MFPERNEALPSFLTVGGGGGGGGGGTGTAGAAELSAWFARLKKNNMYIYKFELKISKYFNNENGRLISLVNK